MTTTAPNLAALWAEHLARAFPRGRPESEYCGHDFVDLVELDTFLAGYISQVANGSLLSNSDARKLNEITGELERTAPSLQGMTANYFQSLLSIARIAVATSGRAAE